MRRIGAASCTGSNRRGCASRWDGFKEPTFFENFARGLSWEIRISSPNVAELEVGVERGAARVTYFTAIPRLDEYSSDAGGPDSTNYFNVGGAIASGIETSVIQNAGARVVLSLNYTYLHTRVEKSGSPSNPNGLFVRVSRSCGGPRIRWRRRSLLPSGGMGV